MRADRVGRASWVVRNCDEPRHVLYYPVAWQDSAELSNAYCFVLALPEPWDTDVAGFLCPLSSGSVDDASAACEDFFAALPELEDLDCEGSGIPSSPLPFVSVRPDPAATNWTAYVLPSSTDKRRYPLLFSTSRTLAEQYEALITGYEVAASTVKYSPRLHPSAFHRPPLRDVDHLNTTECVFFSTEAADKASRAQLKTLAWLMRTGGMAAARARGAFYESLCEPVAAGPPGCGIRVSVSSVLLDVQPGDVVDVATDALRAATAQYQAMSAAQKEELDKAVSGIEGECDVEEGHRFDLAMADAVFERGDPISALVDPPFVFSSLL